MNKGNPLDWKLRVTMPDGSVWDVPVKLIAENRARYYAKHDGVSFDESLNDDTIPVLLQCEGHIVDWAANNMNWSDVAPFVVRVPDAEEPVDWEDGWCNGDKEIIKE